MSATEAKIYHFHKNKVEKVKRWNKFYGLPSMGKMWYCSFIHEKSCSLSTHLG